MKLTYDSVTGELRKSVPGFDRLYEDHLAQYDELLPHVLFGDLVRYLQDEARIAGPPSVAVLKTIELLEDGMGSDDPKLLELISASFLENLEPDQSSYGLLRSLMGPKLIEQLQKFEKL